MTTRFSKQTARCPLNMGRDVVITVNSRFEGRRRDITHCKWGHVKRSGGVYWRIAIGGQRHPYQRSRSSFRMRRTAAETAVARQLALRTGTESAPWSARNTKRHGTSRGSHIRAFSILDGKSRIVTESGTLAVTFSYILMYSLSLLLHSDCRD